MAESVVKLDSFVAHAGQVNCISIGRSSHRFIATGGDDRKVNIWTIGNPAARVSLVGHTTAVEAVQFDSHDQIVVAGSSSGTIKLWNIDQPKKSHTLTGHKSNIRCLEFHPFGEFVASGSLDTNLKIWDIKRKGCIQTYKGHTDAINCLRFSPDGHWVVSGSDDGAIKLWDLTAGKLITEFREHRAAITTLEFHPNEFLLASGSADRTVKFWDLETFRCVSTSHPEASPIKCLAFSKNGDAIYSGGNDSFRAHGWEPSVCLDSFPTSWGRIKDMTAHNNKLLAASAYKDSVSLHLVDLTRVNHDRSKPKKTIPTVSPMDERPITTSKRHQEPSKPQPRKSVPPPTRPAAPAPEDSLPRDEVFGARPKIPREEVVVGAPPPRTSQQQQQQQRQKQEQRQVENPTVPADKGTQQQPSQIQAPSQPYTAPEPASPAVVLVPSKAAAVAKPASEDASAATGASGSESRPLPSGGKSQQRRSGGRMLPDPASTSSLRTAAVVEEENKEQQQQGHGPAHGHAAEANHVAESERPLSETGHALWDKTDRVVIPAMRDKPLDLDFNDFLPAPAGPATEMSENQVMDCIDSGHDALMRVMGTRVLNLEMFRGIWSKGEKKRALEQLVDLEDSAALSDILGFLVRDASQWTLDLAVAVAPGLGSLVRSQHDSYVVNACKAVALIAKSFGALIRDTVRAPPAGHGIDITREERHEKCSLCYENLMVVRELLGQKSTKAGTVGSQVRRAEKALQVLGPAQS